MKEEQQARTGYAFAAPLGILFATPTAQEK
jgi:hypothetical protein